MEEEDIGSNPNNIERRSARAIKRNYAATMSDEDEMDN